MVVPRSAQLMLASFVGTATLIATPGSAYAVPNDSASQVREAHIARADIVRMTHPADIASPDISIRAKENARVRDFLDRQARNGDLLRRSDVRVATVENPLEDGTITLVWHGANAPGEVVLKAVGDNEDGAMGVGFQFAPDGSSETLSGAPAGLAGGSGYSAAISYADMYKFSNGCANAYWDASYSTYDYHVESCFEKWAQSGTRYWAYNRWGLFTRPASSTRYPDIRDFTIRSRPWKVDLYHPDNYVAALNNWDPPGPTSYCQTNNYSVGAYGASITFPAQTCSTTILHIDTGQKMIGIGVEGHEPTGRQARLDVAGHFSADNSTAIPIWADYAWATVSYHTTQGSTAYDNYVLKDSGW